MADGTRWLAPAPRLDPRPSWLPAPTGWQLVNDDEEPGSPEAFRREVVLRTDADCTDRPGLRLPRARRDPAGLLHRGPERSGDGTRRAAGGAVNGKDDR